jgi:hypothetical protein
VRGVDHSPPFSAEVKEKVELYLYSPLWAIVACSSATFTFTFVIISNHVTERNVYVIKLQIITAVM